MGDLSVTVRLHGEVVEDTVLPLRRTTRIGDDPSAVVAFPGADVVVVRAGERLLVRGRALEEGDALELSLGPVEVTVEHTLRGRTPPEWRSSFDVRFLGVVALVTAVGTWLDVAEAWWARDPLALGHRNGVPSAQVDEADRAQGEASVQRPALAGGTAEVAPELDAEPEDDQAQGPRHLADDEHTGTAWSAWYRRAVPQDDQVSGAYLRLRDNPSDAAAHRVVAQAAYDADEYDVAVWHYRWLVQQDPGDRTLMVRLARAEKRRGRHAREADLYRRVLEDDPTNPDALGGLAVALARMGRLDEAVTLVDELQAAAPTAPATDMTVALISAIQGQEREAIEALDRAVAARGQLTDELQLELRRDLALDPALADLRKDKRLRATLHRHMGAAAPTPTR
ncbi:tetratricopeptide repeat protein [Myxococcota bacterium]|nr:tetratricopeptide repeat protein [Myxococcota bacterium]